MEPAGELWGLPADEAEGQVRQRHGAAWRVAAIGPRVRGWCATRPCRTTDGTPAAAGSARCWGRSGSKPWPCGAPAARPHCRFGRGVEGRRDLRARSFGPATEKYRELGTLANLLSFNAISAPRRATSRPRSSRRRRLAAEELHELRQVAQLLCVVFDRLRAHIQGAGRQDARVEYENVFALGLLCVPDPDALAASARCDELGLDTISAGGTIAWAMECAERGLDRRAPGCASATPARFFVCWTRSDHEGLGDLLARASAPRP